MSFCEAIFNKKIDNLTLADIVAFFEEEKEETGVLEFKSGNVSADKIYAEVSGFLNTQGGLLIYGAPKEIQKTGYSYKIAQGDLTPGQLTQDSLMQGIGAGIVPAPTFIKPKSFQKDGGNIIILDIPQSPHAPHQVSKEGKYYLRNDRETKAAQHGVVEALFYKRQKSNLKGNFSSTPSKDNAVVTFSFKLENDSDIAAENVGYIFTVRNIGSPIIPANSTYNWTFEDGVFEVNYNTEKILVKGIAFQLTQKMVLISRFCLVQLAFFCRDCPAIIKWGIYDVQARGFIDQYNSLVDSREKRDAMDEQFNQLKGNDYKYAITGLYRAAIVPQTQLSSLENMEVNLLAPLPASYVMFMRITDGFTVNVKGGQVIFYSCKELPKKITSYDLNISTSIDIGSAGLFTISITYYERSAPAFEIRNRNGMHVVGSYSSFLETLGWLHTLIDE